MIMTSFTSFQKSAPMARKYRKSTLLASLALLAIVAGCAKSSDTTGSISEPADYRDRHPIVIDSAPKSISIYPMRGPGGLDRRQVDDIQDFAQEYRRTGRGHISVLLPSGSGKEQSQTLGFIRKELSAAGIPAAYLRNGHYEPMRPNPVSPVKIEFEALTAKVATECGKWDNDILEDVNGKGSTNRDYSNFGCSYQSILAAQVDDPADLSRPRRMTDGDIGKRTDDVTQIRSDSDPSTNWSNNAANIGQ
jgi:pilus assembly protein CpaD